jgi:hypothetical protein
METPTPTTQPPPPPRRYGRTAAVVFVVSLATSGLFFLLARLLDSDPNTQDVLSTFGITTGSVGLVWSFILATKALLASPHAKRVPIFILLTVGWCFSIPLLMTWRDGNRGSSEDTWAILHTVCIPFLIPVLTISASMALALLGILRRFSVHRAASI